MDPEQEELKQAGPGKDYWKIILRYKYWFLTGFVLLIFLLIFRPHLVLTLVMTAATGATIYYSSQYQIPVDFNPTIFCSVIITLVAGIPSMIFYVIFGVAVPAMLTGKIGPSAPLFWGVLIGMNFAVPFLSGMPLLLIGLAVSLIKVFLAFVINLTLGMNPVRIGISEVVHVTINMILFFRLGELVLALSGVQG